MCVCVCECVYARACVYYHRHVFQFLYRTFVANLEYHYYTSNYIDC